MADLSDEHLARMLNFWRNNIPEAAEIESALSELQRRRAQDACPRSVSATTLTLAKESEHG